MEMGGKGQEEAMCVRPYIYCDMGPRHLDLVLVLFDQTTLALHIASFVRWNLEKGFDDKRKEKNNGY